MISTPVRRVALNRADIENISVWMRTMCPLAINPILSVGVECEACFPHSMGCHGIAVPPCVAHYFFLQEVYMIIRKQLNTFWEMFDFCHCLGTTPFMLCQRVIPEIVNRINFLPAIVKIVASWLTDFVKILCLCSKHSLEILQSLEMYHASRDT